MPDCDIDNVVPEKLSGADTVVGPTTPLLVESKELDTEEMLRLVVEALAE